MDYHQGAIALKNKDIIYKFYSNIKLNTSFILEKRII